MNTEKDLDLRKMEALGTPTAVWDDDGNVEYTVRVRPKAPAKSEDSEIYLSSGKLNVPLLVKQARILSASGEFKLARNVFHAILKSGEANATALHGLGVCFESEGQLDSAQKSFEEAIAFQPTMNSFRHLATLLIKQEKDLDAARVLERALNMKDVSRDDRFNMSKACGNCWLRLENVEKAEHHYRAALEMNPDAGEIQSNLGSLYLQAGKIGIAKNCFEKSISSSHDNHKAHMGLGCCYLAEKDKKAAHESFANALMIDMNNPTAIYYLVKCAYELRQYARAEKIVSQYVESAPVNANLLYALAGLQFHVGKMRQARMTSEKLLELKSEHKGAKDLIGLIEKNRRSS